jgi:transglutaminase-like putative cysteine protease
MKLRFIVWCLLLLSPAVLRAGDGRYAVSGISPVLLLNANAIVRLEELKFEIRSTKETIQTNHYVITVFNENGDRWAEFSEYYDNMQSITAVEGVLYDAQGSQLKKMKKKDLQDFNGASEGTFVDDSRVKYHNFYQRSYPYTVEYTVEITHRSTLFFPMWSPRSGSGISVEKSSLSVVCPSSYQFRYKSFLYNGEPAVVNERNTRTTRWSVTNQPAIVKESYSPLWHELSTVVILGPTEFQVDNYKGNMMSWKDFGKFVYSLKAGRDVLPENVKQTVHQIADALADPRQKISRLYEYMQKNTRYVGVQLGIGGWQPFDAKYVAANGYGDCKALVNYMYSLLKEAGVNSYYTLIRAGKNASYITSDFPSQQFNHVILCVPLQKDTVWLECTSQTLPAGYLGDFTAGRFALMVDETGGQLVHTPEYGKKENLQLRHIKAVLEDNGTLQLTASTNYEGLQQDNIHDLINNLSRDKVKEYLHEELDFATYDVKQFDYREHKTAMPEIDEALDISVSNYATITGKRLFIIPNIMTRSYQKPIAYSPRRYDILLGMEYTDVDTVAIQLPDGYEAEAIPADVSLTTAFGTYQSTVKLEGNKIYYYRRMEQSGGRFPAADYPQLLKFYEAIYKADRARIVLRKR